MQLPVWKVVFAQHLRMRRGADELYEHRHLREFHVPAPDRMAAIESAEQQLDAEPVRLHEDQVFQALLAHGFVLEARRATTMPICEQDDPSQPAAV